MKHALMGAIEVTMKCVVLSTCPAGTPISHGGRADLLGLLKFLQVPHIPQGTTASTSWLASELAVIAARSLAGHQHSQQVNVRHACS